ncbi:MAG: hypothetical protein RL717_2808 [Pseudomonadota bacterium]
MITGAIKIIPRGEGIAVPGADINGKAFAERDFNAGINGLMRKLLGGFNFLPQTQRNVRVQTVAEVVRFFDLDLNVV